jgi:hypothetical protein
LQNHHASNPSKGQRRALITRRRHAHGLDPLGGLYYPRNAPDLLAMHVTRASASGAVEVMA